MIETCIHLAPAVASVVSDSVQPHRQQSTRLPVPGILQARTLEWVAIPSSRGSSQPRDQTHMSYISCINRQILYHWHHLRNHHPIWSTPFDLSLTMVPQSTLAFIHNLLALA